jgi:cation diffusion facilitator CzcD-associated flavoprotein CzcO
LEQNYYEMFNLPHVDLIDLNSEPIVEFTETGIRTKHGLSEFDLIVLATGFDSVTGPLAQLDIRNTKGQTIAEHWEDGLKTAIGIALAGFPNMFYLYGPQAPTAFSNGPTHTELQTSWIEKVIGDLTQKGITRFEAKPEKEAEWTKLTRDLWYSTLYHRAKGWYQGEPRLACENRNLFKLNTIHQRYKHSRQERGASQFYRRDSPILSRALQKH